MTILLTNIQRFSLHDGPGIRTTVFLKGCSLQCPWCSNPENINHYPETYCKDGIMGIYGKYFEPEAIVTECLKDQKFYDGKLLSPDMWRITAAEQIEQLPGGVTFSGGECLLQMESLVPVCRSLHENNVHLAVETCLFISAYQLKLALENIDLFYVDMKILDHNQCMKLIGGNLDLYLYNLDILMNSGKPIIIRIPVIGSYTDRNENRKAIYNLINKYRNYILKIELIKEHNLAESKYKSLNMKMDYHGVEDDFMEKYKEELSDLGIMTEICRI